MNFLNNLKLYLRFKYWAKLRINNFPSYYSSHSQFGEDMVIRSILGDKHNGFFIDIGAHHPVYCSNTYHFYQKGWKGINIDAIPGSMEIFNLLRDRDINIETCIGPNSGEEVSFYVFDKPGLNTFDAKMAELAKKSSKHLNTLHLKTKTLEQCLDDFLPNNQIIDFMSIDVEGVDEIILRSNNWKKYSPKLIIFESFDLSLENLKNEGLIKYLNDLGYSIVGKAGHSFIAKLRD